MQPTYPNRLHNILNAGQVSSSSSAVAAAGAVDKLAQLNASLSDANAPLVVGVSGVSEALRDDKGSLLTRVERSTAGIEAIATWFGNNPKIAAIDPTDIKRISQALSDPNGTLLTAICAIPSHLDRNVDRILSVLCPTLPATPRAAEQLMACLRVINQVEDLVADTTFTVAKNNKDIQTRFGEQPTKDALKLLSGNQQLESDFKDIYAPFAGKPDLLQERLERIGKIQRLRLNLSAFFA